jgi:hypothetical protein
MVKQVARKHSKTVRMPLTSKERELLLGFLIMDDALEGRLKQASSADAEVSFTLGELLGLYGWLNAPGNQSPKEEIQRSFDRICERAQRLIPEDMFED